jgi:AmiR/NasT family two-component response regulator
VRKALFMETKQKFRIVIADDDNLAGLLIQRHLKKNGHDVVGIASNGLQAVEMVRTLTPDIILMDIEMPEMSGLEAANIIQRESPLPVVLLTSHNNPEMVQQASAVGVGAYLLKPPSAEEIERTMIIAFARFSDLMELRRLNEELQKALDKVKVLSGLLPICSHCKKIRDDQGYWQAVEAYIIERSDARFSHGICPDCMNKYYSSYSDKIRKMNEK